MTPESDAPATPAPATAMVTPPVSDVDQAIAFAKQVVSVVASLTPLIDAAVPVAAPAIDLGVKIVTGALDMAPSGEALWNDIQAAANGTAAPSAAVLAASIAAAAAANTEAAAAEDTALAGQKPGE